MTRSIPPARLAELPTENAGLPSGDVARRRERYGANHIVEAAPPALGQLARATARDPMIWFLVGTAVIYLVLRQTAEAITLLASILPLVGMDAYLHRRSQASTRSLRDLLADTARVVRDGAAREVASGEVVVGDLVLVQTGEPFPADGLIVEAEDAQVDESALTGESIPVRKHALGGLPDATNDAGAPIDDVHWGLAGTRLLTGRAGVRIAFTGGETLYGEIVRMATGAIAERTPLQRAVARLVTGLLVAAALLCLVLAAIRLAQGHGWIDALVSAATLAVAALPEEFPVVLSVFLGVGVYRLARRRALVRRAVAVENIGRVSCICADKTGTLTEGRLRVARIEPAPTVSPLETLAVAAAASRRESGDPLDRAILDALAERAAPRVEGAVLATFPFTEDRRRETALLRTVEGDVAFTKGAPETIFALSASSSAEPTRWSQLAGALAGEGYKVIACAVRKLTDGEPRDQEPAGDHEIRGLLAVADPLRAGVVEAVAWCKKAGVRVLMVTGDHPDTARAIARQMGLAEAPSILTGDELAQALDGSRDVLAGVDVVARTLPAQKLSIVRALQAAGELVAVTGDGVNDVPALQAADVGIAMGGRGARSAREVSPIVILDDDFHTIVAAVGEGRALFRNLQLAFLYLLMVHIPFVVTATVIPLVGDPILYLPIHVVWLEAIIHPTALLVFQDRVEAPRPWRTSAREAQLLSRRQWIATIAVGFTSAAIVTLTYARGLAPDGDVEHARAMALTTLTAISAAITAVLSGLSTRAARLAVIATVASTILLVELPPLARLLHLRPLHLDDLALALLGAAVAVTPALVLRSRRHRT